MAEIIGRNMQRMCEQINIKLFIVLYWSDKERKRQIYSDFYKHKTDGSDTDGI
jgi:hypothetical protein